MLGATQPGPEPDLRIGASGPLPFDQDVFQVTMSVNTVVSGLTLPPGLRYWLE
jgi:hypothetical protein